MTDQRPSTGQKWAVTGTRTPTAGHGECSHQLVIGKPDVPVQLLVDDCRNAEAQKLFAEYVCALLNQADNAGACPHCGGNRIDHNLECLDCDEPVWVKP